MKIPNHLQGSSSSAPLHSATPDQPLEKPSYLKAFLIRLLPRAWSEKLLGARMTRVIASVPLMLTSPQAKYRCERVCTEFLDAYSRGDQARMLEAAECLLEVLEEDTPADGVSKQKLQALIQEGMVNACQNLTLIKKYKLRRSMQTKNCPQEKLLAILKAKVAMGGSSLREQATGTLLDTMASLTDQVLGSNKGVPINKRAAALAARIIVGEPSSVTAKNMYDVDVLHQQITCNKVAQANGEVARILMESVALAHEDDWVERARIALQPYTLQMESSAEAQLEHSLAIFFEAVSNHDQDGIIMGGYSLVRDILAVSQARKPGKAPGVDDFIDIAVPLLRKQGVFQQIGKVLQQPSCYTDSESGLIKAMAAIHTCLEWHTIELTKAGQIVPQVAVVAPQLVMALMVDIMPDQSGFCYDSFFRVAEETVDGLDGRAALHPADVRRALQLLMFADKY